MQTVGAGETVAEAIATESGAIVAMGNGVGASVEVGRETGAGVAVRRGVGVNVAGDRVGAMMTWEGGWGDGAAILI